MPASPFRCFNSSPEVIRLVVMMYVRFPLSLRNVEDLLAERGIDICHETVRHWWNRFCPLFAADVRRQRASGCEASASGSGASTRCTCGRRDALPVESGRSGGGGARELRHQDQRQGRCSQKALKRHGSPEAITTDGLRSYKAAMSELGNTEKQEIGRWANNRVKDGHLPFRRRERAMLRFRQMKSLQKFASVHANVHNHFNLERHLVDRETYKTRRSAALAEWQNVKG
jgi:putative transposase